jgi:hypothetical protein
LWVERNREGTHCGVDGCREQCIAGRVAVDWSVLLETTSI